MIEYTRKDLIRLRPRPDSLYISRGRIALVTNRNGFIRNGKEHGLFVHETRMLSCYRLLVNGQELQPVALSKTNQHSWLGYYIQAAPGVDTGTADQGSGMMDPASEYTLEARIFRTIGTGLIEEVRLSNYTQQAITFELQLEVDGDFADIQETSGQRRQQGHLERHWQKTENTWRLAFDYRATHRYDQQGNTGTAGIHRGLLLEISKAGSTPSYSDGVVSFSVDLGPGKQWSSYLTMTPSIEKKEWYTDYSPEKGKQELDRREQVFMHEAATFSTPEHRTLTPVVLDTIKQARQDLSGLRLFDLDHDTRTWMLAAGSPIYLAFYGRDTLTAAWQAAPLGPEMLRGSLAEVGRWQGEKVDDWRDEQPGRLPHEIHTGPLKTLNYTPSGRSYGSVTTSVFYAVAVSEYWHWSGEKELAREFLQTALRAIQWLDKYGDLDGDGIYEYKTRSMQGVKHQAWKDSPDAIVHADGSQVEPPIATCEEQGFVYLAKLRLAELCGWFGKTAQARQLYREARELKQRFNEMFWMEDEKFFAMGLDAENRPIRSIGSNPGHCLATAIVDQSRIASTAKRLLAEDMFSGWGIRTLSSNHPAYNPYSYHRGSVWPVEHGTFSLGFVRYGLHEEMHKICRAQFEAAALFEHYRLPEVFSGHQRTEKQPFPAFYPQANSPQAWSASTVFCMIQSMLGIYPYAPLNLLLVDPHLPPWLPELEVRGLRVGSAKVSLRFFRKKNGSTAYRVEGKEGTLHVVRQASPWSLTTTYKERLKGFLTSLLPHR